MFVWVFQLCEAPPVSSLLDLAPDLLGIAGTGGLGPISWRSRLRSSWVDISRVLSMMAVPACPGGCEQGCVPRGLLAL